MSKQTPLENLSNELDDNFDKIKTDATISDSYWLKIDKKGKI